MRTGAVVTLALLAACQPAPSSPPPSEPDAWRTQAKVTLRRIGVDALCHAELRSDAATLGGDAKDARIAAWLERQIADPEVRALALSELPGLAAAPRAERLSRIATELSIVPCPLGELWRWRGERAAGAGLPCAEACALRLGDGRQTRADCGLGCGSLTAADR
jgi:hypothetical protein